jgi:hypothetical protein
MAGGRPLAQAPRSTTSTGKSASATLRIVAYDLDRLGWLQFEQLCTLLLELEGGIPAHAWAGGADRCRAVLSGTPLRPPLVSVELPAPVLVQCAWQRPAENRRLADATVRLAEQRADDVALAESLLVLTNAELDPRDEAQLNEWLARPNVKVAALGRSGLGARLDARSELRRAMPSVLGLRDPDGLIDQDVVEPQKGPCFSMGNGRSEHRKGWPGGR